MKIETSDVKRWNTMLVVRGRVPRNFRHLKFIDLFPSSRASLRQYCEFFNRKSAHLFLHGPNKVELDRCAAYILKTAVKLSHTVLYLEAEEARRAQRGFEPFDADTTMWERMQLVDVLCIVHLGREKTSDETWTGALSMLISHRVNQQKITILTSHLLPKKFGKLYGSAVTSNMEHGEFLSIGIDL